MQKRVETHLASVLCNTLCIASQNFSSGVNVEYNGSENPSTPSFEKLMLSKVHNLILVSLFFGIILGVQKSVVNTEMTDTHSSVCLFSFRFSTVLSHCSDITIQT